MPEFERLNSYDTPRMVLEQMLDGELTWRGLRQTVFAKDELALQAREGFSRRLQKATGDTSVGNALIGIATNPWVWLGVALTPEFHSVLGSTIKSGKSIFSIAKHKDVFHRQGPWLLQRMGFLTGRQIFDSKLPAAVGDQIYEEMTKHLHQWASATEEGLKEAKATLGIAPGDALNPRVVSDPAKRRILERGLLALYLKQAGLDVEKIRQVPEGKLKFLVREFDEVAKDYGPAREVDHPTFLKLQQEVQADRKAFTPQGEKRFTPRYTFDHLVTEIQWKNALRKDPFTKGMVPAVDGGFATTGDVDAAIAAAGLGKLHEGLVKAKTERWAQLFHDAEGKLDPEKIEQLLVGMTENLPGGGDLSTLKSDSLQGLDLIQAIKSSSMKKAVREGRVSEETYKGLLISLYEKADPLTYMPLNTLDSVEIGGVKLSPEQIKTIRAVGPEVPDVTHRFIPRTEDDVVWHPTHLGMISDYFGDSIALERAKATLAYHVRSRVAGPGDSAYNPNLMGKPLVAHTMDLVSSMDRYAADTAKARVIHQTLINPETTLSYKEVLNDFPHNMSVGAYNDTPGVSDEYLDQAAALADPNFKVAWSQRAEHKTFHNDLTDPENMGRFGSPKPTLGNMLKLSRHLITDPHARATMDEVVLPFAFGETIHKGYISKGQFMEGKKALRWFADSWVAKGLEQTDWGAEFLHRMRLYADDTEPPPVGAGWPAVAAKGFYASHLWLNVPSVVLNMMQPLTIGGTMVGPTHVLRAYPEALKEFVSYSRDRIKTYGIGAITEAQRMDLIKRNFRHHEILGIGPGELDALDQLFMKTQRGNDNSLMGRAFRLGMLMFEKSEWINRNVAAHAAERLMKSHGVTDPVQIKRAARQVTKLTQFADSPMDTPTLMMQSRLMSNPLMRQFLSFSIKSATSILHTIPRMAEQENYFWGLGSGFLRAMAAGAVVNEIAKSGNMDVTRGLPLATFTSLAGNQSFLQEEKGYLPVPPAVEVPLNLIRSFATGDLDLYRETMPRIIPGGVALSRALGVLPKTPLALGLQRTYVDWNQITGDGMVPIYKTDDGSLVDYRPATTLILRSLGADLGKWAQPGELDNYLVKIRDQSVAARRQYLMALKANDVVKAQQIAASYEQRFGVPFTVTKAQVTESIKLSSISRTERTLTRLPNDLKELYTKMVDESRTPAELGLRGPLEGVASKDRVRVSRRMMEDPTVVAELRRVMREKALPGAASDRGASSPFEPFQPF